MEFTGLIISSSADDLPVKELAAASHMSLSTAETTACTAHSRRKGPASNLDDGIFALGRKTECLIRNMRFDNVVLRSRHEDMSRLVMELEEELQSLEKMIGSDDCINQQEKTDQKPPAHLNDSTEGTDSATKSPRWNNRLQHIKKDMANKTIDFGDDSSRDGADSLDLSGTNRHNSPLNKHDNNPIKRFFQWGNRDHNRHGQPQRLSSSLGSTASESNSTIAPTSTWHRSRDDKHYHKKNSADEESVSSHARSVSSAPIFPWLGDPATPRRHSEFDHHRRRQQQSNNHGNLFHRMFQRNSMNGDDYSNSNVSRIEEEQQQQSQPTTTSPNSNDTNISDSTLLSTLELKLQGCNLALSSLQELQSLQTRNLLDLKLSYIHTRIDHESISNRMSSQLHDLRASYSYCQRENKRKERLLREAMGRAKKANDREELLLEEVDCVRTELFAMGGKVE